MSGGTQPTPEPQPTTSGKANGTSYPTTPWQSYSPPPYQPPTPYQSPYFQSYNPLQMQQQSYMNYYRPPVYNPYQSYGSK